MMRVQFVFIVTLTASAMVGAHRLAAQGGNVAGGEQVKAEAGETQVIEGCLSPAAQVGRFRLDNATAIRGALPKPSPEAKPYPTYQIVSTARDVKLGDHVGHKVQLTGSIVSTSSSEAPRIFMSELKMIAPKCP
jgi:hypothetical protein